MEKNSTEKIIDIASGTARQVDHPLYYTWRNMIRSCYSPHSKNYKYCGARGIIICERWRTSFWSFVEDMGQKPHSSYVLYREKNDGNYEPGNTRWATVKEFSNNRTGHHFITIGGKTQNIAQWADEVGIDKDLILTRVKAGHSGEKLLLPAGLLREKKEKMKKSERWGEKGKHPLYATWLSIIHRCRDKNEPYHGKLGIKVCDRWFNSLWDFAEDVGEKPGPEYSLDRYPNKYGDYEPNNVRWATRSEQQNNRRDNKFVTARGKTQTVSQWAIELNIESRKIWSKLRYGWSDEKTIETLATDRKST